MRRKIRLLLPRLPDLHFTLAEKTALITLGLILSAGAGLRAWERSGVRMGPVSDWESLRRLVIRARADNAGIGFPCEDAGDSARAEGSDGSSPGGRKPAGRSVPPKKIPPSSPVDLNAAGERDLAKLPGVGPATVRAILAYRSSHGPFRSIEELLEVKGIGPGKFDKMRKFLRAESPAPRRRSESSP